MFNLRKLLKCDKGNTLIIAAVALPVLVMAVGAAVDFSRYYLVRTKVQSALDSAVLAAASSLSTTPPERLTVDYFAANFPDHYMGSDVTAATLPDRLHVKTDPNSRNQMVVTARIVGSVKSYFLGIVSNNAIKLDVLSQAIRGVKPAEIVLVADHSRSMCFVQGKEGVLDYSCSKMASLRQASKLLVNTLYGGNEVMAGVYMGIVPYATHVKYNTTNGGSKYGGGGMDPRAATNPHQTPIQEFTSSKSKMLSNIDNMRVRTSDELAWTRINVGLDAAWRMLRPDYRSIFHHPNNSVPRAFDGKTLKAIILMTDGRNITYCGTGEGGYKLNAADNTDLLERCDILRKDGILVYTVAFDVSAGAIGAAQTKKLLKDCATNDNYYFDASDDTSLKYAFKAIADSLRSVQLTY